MRPLQSLGPGADGGRVARRRRRMRQALLEAGARQFAARGIGAVSVEDLLAEADVSRATFYGFFSSKYSLLEELLNPIFEKSTAAVRALEQRPPREALEGVFRVYRDLWRAHREGLLLIPAVDPSAFRHFEPQHRALNEALLNVLIKAEQAHLLRNGSASYSLRVLARTAIPLLKVYDGHPSGEALFEDAIGALLMRAR
ncbi:MAG: TetR/AcrR family transcriptional regulator [Rhodospirillaceae bacterium]|nr:TetR/AcrR family transcriptional regulator [Rhodospirillaceae bacterium]